MKVPLHDHILDTLHSLVQQIRVRGIGVVDIYFSGLVPDEVFEFIGKELRPSLDILLGPFVIGKEIDNIRPAGGYLVCEEIHLVEEKN